MEPSEFLTPVVVVTVISAIVGLIVKAVRLQSKVDGQADELKRQGEKIAEQRGILDAHRDNDDIHFNLRINQQVEQRQNERFQRVEERLGHIEGKLDQLIGSKNQ